MEKVTTGKEVKPLNITSKRLLAIRLQIKRSKL